MSPITGLKEIQEAIAPRETVDFQKVDWLKLRDGDVVKARFVEELDEDSPNYSVDRGLSVIIKEHINPEDFRRKMTCTADEGNCVGCELAKAYPKLGWYAKKRWYGNILVDNGKDAPHITVWSRTASERTEFAEIVDEAVDTGSVSNKTWRIKRAGTGTDTRYSLRPGTPDAEEFDWTGYEFFDLDQVIPNIEYDRQERWILGDDAVSNSDNGETSSDVPWNKEEESTVEW